MTSLTEQAKKALTEFLCKGAVAIDATAGNGHDTAFLAERVGKSGQVFAFDIQQQAIEHTRSRLQRQLMEQQVTLIVDSHENMLDHIPEIYFHKVAVIMFNLGYLPGSDKHCITHTDSTLAALEQAKCLVKPGGAISVMLYPGHAGGQQETNAVLEWRSKLLHPWQTSLISTQGPQWLLISQPQLTAFS
jgi:ubiquinone/menaquinone biosynthesis C-methylase UbiE